MKTLLLGATGNLGSRIIPALLSHNHQVFVFVRNPQKLKSILPSSLFEKLEIIQGDATSESDIASALKQSDPEVLVTAAGYAPVLPWPKSNVPQIESATITALEKFSAERKRKIRSWVLGGMLLLDIPGSAGKYKLVDYLPLFPDDLHKIPLLEQSSGLKWTCVCPAKMSALSSDVKSLEEHTHIQSQRKPLSSAVSVPPGWIKSSLTPLLGSYADVLSNCLSMRNAVVFEDVAEFIASNLGNEEFVGERVGLIKL